MRRKEGAAELCGQSIQLPSRRHTPLFRYNNPHTQNRSYFEKFEDSTNSFIVMVTTCIYSCRLLLARCEAWHPVSPSPLRRARGPFIWAGIAWSRCGRSHANWYVSKSMSSERRGLSVLWFVFETSKIGFIFVRLILSLRSLQSLASPTQKIRTFDRMWKYQCEDDG